MATMRAALCRAYGPPRCRSHRRGRAARAEIQRSADPYPCDHGVVGRLACADADGAARHGHVGASGVRLHPAAQANSGHRTGRRDRRPRQGRHDVQHRRCGRGLSGLSERMPRRIPDDARGRPDHPQAGPAELRGSRGDVLRRGDGAAFSPRSCKACGRRARAGDRRIGGAGQRRGADRKVHSARMSPACAARTMSNWYARSAPIA